jgi:uncharacterized repeat protein (TIGR01451 family)
VRGDFRSIIAISSVVLGISTLAVFAQTPLVNQRRSQGIASTSASPAPISSQFFGMTIVNIPAAPWPTTLGFQFSVFRTLGVQLKWSDIETCDGGSDPNNPCYTWTAFDQWINNTALANGQDVLYVAYYAPSWASSKPNDTTCAGGRQPPGGCDPPNDIDATPGSGLGDGSDQHFIDFLTAIESHQGPGKIKFWALWNEPNVLAEWTGTYAQLVRLAKDLRNTILASDPSALFLSPAYVGGGNTTQLAKYLAAGGGQYADIIAYHGYISTGTCPSNCPIPENEGPYVDWIRRVLTTYGQQNKPLEDLEGSWGALNGIQTITDPDQQTAFTARFYLMHLSKGIDRFYWYAWNSPINGHFYDTTNKVVIPAGIAYEQIYNWTVGATLTAPCSNIGTTWSCSFTRPNGYVAETLWDSSLMCANGICPTNSVQVPTNYSQYRTISGETFPIRSNTVPVGSKPILIEGTSPGISVVKTASTTRAIAGSPMAYTITVTNNTTSSIAPVTVTDNLDTSLTLNSCSATGTGNCQVSGNAVTVNFSSMAAAETDTITLNVTVGSSATGSIVNSAAANWATAQGAAANNWSTVSLPIGTPAVSLSPTGLNFGNQTINTTSLAQTLTVKNVGNGYLTLYNIGASGTNEFDFSFSSAPLPITVKPGYGTNIRIKFKPSALGQRTGILNIDDNTSAGLETLGLTGYGLLASNIALQSSANPTMVGSSVTFTVTVTGPATVPTGTITFKDGTSALSTATLNSSGVVTFSTSSLAAGTHNIIAAYSGDNTYGAGRASLTQHILWPTTTSVSSSLNPSTYGQSITFTAQVTSSGGVPSGTVTFFNGKVGIGKVGLASGTASLTTSPTALTRGSHSITAKYGGSTAYATSTSPVLTQTVR